MKMESLESALVRLSRVRLPQVFESCDRDGDKQATFFCETPIPVLTEQGERIACETSSQCGEDSCFKEDLTDPSTWYCQRWVWRDCDPDEDPVGLEAEEIQCNIDCTTGQGKHTGELCTERSAYEGFGQVAVVLPGPGSASVGLDETLSSKLYTRTIPADWQDVENRFLRVRGPSFVPGTELLVSCTAPAKLRLGTADTLAGAQPVELAANTLFRHLGHPAGPTDRRHGVRGAVVHHLPGHRHAHQCRVPGCAARPGARLP
jgi:hypothetical protein